MSRKDHSHTEDSLPAFLQRPCPFVQDGELQRYLMFYEAIGADGRRSIGLAASEDGIRGWQRLDRCAF